MKKLFVKILLCALLAAFVYSVSVGCVFFARPLNRTQTKEEIIFVTDMPSLLSVCIDEDKAFFESALDENEFILFEEYRQFTQFFEGYDYGEYSHLLMYFEGFSFWNHNMLIFRTEPLKESKTLRFAGWFLASLSSSENGEGMHYYLVVVEKEVTAIEILP